MSSIPLVVSVASASCPGVPNGLKSGASVGPNDGNLSPNTPVVQYGGYTYWAHSYDDNRVSFNIVAYDAAGKVVKQWDKPGARYIYKITVDSAAQTITFWGQSDQKVVMSWNELLTPVDAPTPQPTQFQCILTLKGNVSKIDGTLSNATLDTQGPGGCTSVHINGSDNSFVSFGTQIGQFGTNDFTVAFWVQTTEAYRYFDLAGNRAAGSHGNFFCIRMTGKHESRPAGLIGSEVDQDQNGTNYIGVESKTAGFNDGKWHHIAAVRKGTSLKLYIDGVVSGNGSGQGVANIANGNTFKLGRSLVGVHDKFAADARYSDLRVYDTALNDSEISSLFSGQQTQPLTAGNEVKSRGVSDTATNFYIVDTNNPFNSNGEVNTWEIWAEKTTPVQLIIYRKDAGSWSVVGKSDVKTPVVGLNQFSLSAPITVKKGDYVGFYSPQAGSVSFNRKTEQEPWALGNLSGTILFTASGANATAFSNSCNRTYSITVKGTVTAEVPKVPPSLVALIYEHANFQGASQELVPGNYKMADLKIPNDSLSSLRVPAGLKVTLYEHEFTGRSKTFTADAGWVGDDFNDITSSVKVEVVAAEVPKVPPSFDVPGDSPNGYEFINTQNSATSYTFTASGTWSPDKQNPNLQGCTAEGLPSFNSYVQDGIKQAWPSIQENMKYPKTPFALIAENTKTGEVIQVGKKATIVLKPGENLRFVLNDAVWNYDNNSGSIKVDWVIGS